MPEQASVTMAMAIQYAIEDSMAMDETVIHMGLGVNDPGRVFGTTSGLVEKFGVERVFETPTSENAMTGVVVGAALSGLRPIAVHQRLDFFLLAIDQLVNSAAKWRFMFGDQFQVPAVFRLILGRGWGQGPTHSQSLHSWFVHIPGLKVVMPSSPQEAYDLMRSAIDDNNPVIFLEHRWLHGAATQCLSRGKNPSSLENQSTKILTQGGDVTLVSTGIGTIECLAAAEVLKLKGISAEVININLLTGDLGSILDSSKTTGKVMVVDHGLPKASYGSWLISEIAINSSSADVQMDLLTFPDLAEASGRGLLSNYHPNADMIVQRVLEKFFDTAEAQTGSTDYVDVPSEKFKGPF